MNKNMEKTTLSFTNKIQDLNKTDEKQKKNQNGDGGLKTVLKTAIQKQKI